MNPVLKPNSTLMAELTELIATGNFYNGGKLHLFQAPIAFSPNLTVADFAECDFTTYAESAVVVFTAPFLSPSGIPTTDGQALSWNTGPTPTVFNTVYGWYLTDSTGATLIFWRSFDVPIVLSVANQGFTVVPAIPAYVSQ